MLKFSLTSSLPRFISQQNHLNSKSSFYFQLTFEQIFKNIADLDKGKVFQRSVPFISDQDSHKNQLVHQAYIHSFYAIAPNFS